MMLRGHDSHEAADTSGVDRHTRQSPQEQAGSGPRVGKGKNQTRGDPDPRASVCMGRSGENMPKLRFLLLH